MKKNISIIAALCLGLVFGCSKTNREQKQVTKIMDMIQQTCQPTPGQAAKLHPLVQNFVHTRTENMEKYNNDRQGFINAMQAARKTLKDSLTVLLSPQQMQQLEQHIQNNSQKGNGGGD